MAACRLHGWQTASLTNVCAGYVLWVLCRLCVEIRLGGMCRVCVGVTLLVQISLCLSLRPSLLFCCARYVFGMRRVCANNTCQLCFVSFRVAVPSMCGRSLCAVCSRGLCRLCVVITRNYGQNGPCTYPTLNGTRPYIYIYI